MSLNSCSAHEDQISADNVETQTFHSTTVRTQLLVTSQASPPRHTPLPTDVKKLSSVAGNSIPIARHPLYGYSTPAMSRISVLRSDPKRKNSDGQAHSVWVFNLSIVRSSCPSVWSQKLEFWISNYYWQRLKRNLSSGRMIRRTYINYMLRYTLFRTTPHLGKRAWNTLLESFTEL